MVGYMIVPQEESFEPSLIASKLCRRCRWNRIRDTPN